MKAYVLSDADFERLLLRLDQDQRQGVTLTREQQVAQDDAKRRYNYEVRVWIGEVQK